MHKPFVHLLTVIAMAGSLVLLAQEPQNPQPSKSDQPSAEQPKANASASDHDIMQNIRKALTSDDALSAYAHSVKIAAKNGKVTLKGNVRSDADKQAIESKATEVAGAGNVTNELMVKAEK
jgi:osmotically-inducible protein OsmY